MVFGRLPAVLGNREDQRRIPEGVSIFRHFCTNVPVPLGGIPSEKKNETIAYSLPLGDEGTLRVTNYSKEKKRQLFRSGPSLFENFHSLKAYV